MIEPTEAMQQSALDFVTKSSGPRPKIMPHAGHWDDEVDTVAVGMAHAANLIEADLRQLPATKDMKSPVRDAYMRASNRVVRGDWLNSEQTRSGDG